MRVSRKSFSRPSIAAAILVSIAIAILAASCAKGASGKKIESVAVFVPGMVAGSPIYEKLVEGAKKAADEAGASFLALEAGFDQSAWESKLTELALSGKWDLIVSSNPSIPELCVKALEAAPKQRFFIADGYLAGNPMIATALYNQVEQGYVAGYMAGLVAKEGGAGKGVAAGVVVAQHYPTFDKAIFPGFELGLEKALPGAKAELRVVGNWFDAQKAKELSESLVEAGARALFPVAGGASQGVVAAAQAEGVKVVWSDATGYDLAPGTVAGCAVLRQDRLVYERVSAALKGKLAYGKAEILGFKEGYVDFDDAHPLYAKGSSEAARAEMAEILSDLRTGKLVLESPTF